MPNVINIQLEVDDAGSRTIEQFSAESTQQIDQVGDAATRTGERGRLGFRQAGNAAEILASRLGLPGSVIGDLTQEFESQAVKGIPRWAMALTIAGAAAAAATLAVMSFVEHKKKMREELERTTEALLGETRQLIRNREENEAYLRASYDKLIAQRAQALSNISKLIPEKLEELAKLERLIAGPGVMEAGAKRIAEHRAEMRRDADVLRAEINALRTERELLRNETVSFEEYSGAEARAEEARQRTLQIQQDYNSALLANMQESGASQQEVLDQELLMLADHWDEKYRQAAKAGADMYDLQVLQATKELALSTRRMQTEEKIDQNIMQNKATVFGGVAQVMDQLYTITGERQEAFFYFSRSLAAAEAYIQYQLAAAKAVGQTGIFGLSMKAYFQAMSYIVPSLIAAQTIVGGPGGTTPATPTFTANPITGLPETTAAAEGGGPQFILIVNGEEQTVGDLLPGIARELARRGGEVGGFSVGIKRVT